MCQLSFSPISFTFFEHDADNTVRCGLDEIAELDLQGYKFGRRSSCQRKSCSAFLVAGLGVGFLLQQQLQAINGISLSCFHERSTAFECFFYVFAL